MIDEKRICKNDFSFEYAGPDYAELVSQLQTYGIEYTANDHGFVSRETSIAMQKQADALLLLTWNEKSYQGVIPGKIFEYMAIGNVPIIALITGDVKESEVTKLIRTSNAGCACEMAVETDMQALKKFVIDLFNGQVSTGGKREEYDYQNVSRKYIEIM